MIRDNQVSSRLTVLQLLEDSRLEERIKVATSTCLISRSAIFDAWIEFDDRAYILLSHNRSKGSRS